MSEIEGASVAPSDLGAGAGVGAGAEAAEPLGSAAAGAGLGARAPPKENGRAVSGGSRAPFRSGCCCGVCTQHSRRQSMGAPADEAAYAPPWQS